MNCKTTDMLITQKQILFIFLIVLYRIATYLQYNLEIVIAAKNLQNFIMENKE